MPALSSWSLVFGIGHSALGIDRSSTNPLSPNVRGQNEDAVVLREGSARIGDELVAIEVCGQRWVQSLRHDQFGEARHFDGQCAEQLTQRSRLDFQRGDAGTLARNAEELNVHNWAASL